MKLHNKIKLKYLKIKLWVIIHIEKLVNIIKKKLMHSQLNLFDKIQKIISPDIYMILPIQSIIKYNYVSKIYIKRIDNSVQKYNYFGNYQFKENDLCIITYSNSMNKSIVNKYLKKYNIPKNRTKEILIIPVNKDWFKNYSTLKEYELVSIK